ncbi:class I SAM-dependent methyltransferase [Dyella sp. 7MK23]|uniref:Class I SAM-dependent methyltransferase n=2 Tax=Dyella acidiphila TaxID=2775866 RepID=A0ABR9G8Q1_9GAMM|nr:class I SAM-dependent methyltransferase [Dyella acidiphila]
MQPTEQARQPHAVLDMPSRRWKAMKIHQLLGLTSRAVPLRLLEVGTGSGGIAHYFGTHPDLRCEVDAVDVHDNRMIRDGYRFQLVTDTKLPFEDHSFDVVISNHVIEHVGTESDQREHLRELRRVMKPDGLGYLAVPNRWMLVEPHYRLAFLSWWPHAWRDTYLRIMNKGHVYDCEPLEMRQLEHLLVGAGFRYSNQCIEAWRLTFDIERPEASATRLMRKIPDALLKPLRPIIPTLIYRIWQ